jgi:membrane protein
MKRLGRLHVLFHRAVMKALDNDALNLAQSCAYSAIVSLFPALIVAAAVIGLLPDTAPIRAQLGAMFDRILPSDVSPLLQGYFVPSAENARPVRVIVVAFFVSITGASSVIATLMDGLRRAAGLPPNCWNTFWSRRLRAYLLVPMSLVPLALASLIVVFGHYITVWLGMHVDSAIRTPVYIVAMMIRWTVALTGSVALIALIYHMGTPAKTKWHRTLPGAIFATFSWFLTTLAFGWYVTRFANYSQVYGSLGAAIALLFWLYLISLSVLCGAEFNAQFHEDLTTPVLEVADSAAHSAPHG